MEFLVLGRGDYSGGREHALALNASQRRFDSNRRVFYFPENPGIAEFGEIVPVVRKEDPLVELMAFAAKRKIDLAIVGPEALLENGVVDSFERFGLPIWGPTSGAARLETSKLYAKRIMVKYGIPTADYVEFSPNDLDVEEKVSGFMDANEDLGVAKTDGLENGKGVEVVRGGGQALQAITSRLNAGKKALLEQYLKGIEVSTTAICSGIGMIPLVVSEDEKPVWKNGPNGGGQGVYTPVDDVTPELEGRLFEITEQLLWAMNKEGIFYRGFIYPNFRVVDGEPKVMEVNTRFGDPDAQSILELMDFDLAPLLHEIYYGGINSSMKVGWKSGYVMSLALVSQGYPDEGNLLLERPITGIERAIAEGVTVFHAGTRLRDDGVLVNIGGRVLTVVGRGSSLREARDKSLRGAERIWFEGMNYRRDLGERNIPPIPHMPRLPDPLY